MPHSSGQTYQPTATATTSLLSCSPRSFYTTHDADLLLPFQKQNEERHSRGKPTPSTASSDTLPGLSRPQRTKDNADNVMEETQPLLRSSSSTTSTSTSSTSTSTSTTGGGRKHQGSSFLAVLRSSVSELVSGSVYLENSGSVARDHLANERTFLAWLRTSLSTISVGIGITQLFRLDRAVEHDSQLRTWGRPVGLIFILMSILFLFFAFVRYFHCQATMVKGYFPASRGIVLFTAASTFLSMVALLFAVYVKH